eukprot:gene29351-38887_t
MTPELSKPILQSIFQFSLLAIIIALFTFTVLFKNEPPQMMGSQFQNRRYLLSNPLQDAFRNIHQQKTPRSNAFASATAPDDEDSGASERGRGLFRRRRRRRKNLRATLDRIMQSDINGSIVALSSTELDLAVEKGPVTLVAASGSRESFDPAAPMAAISCVNQTRCIQPQLQLRQHFSVYFCKHVGHGVRFYFLVREGLLLHPNIHLVSSPDDADFVVYLPTVVLDEGDYPQLFSPEDGAGDFLLYFKRSFVRRSNGIFHGYMNYLTNVRVLPMTYTIMEAYVRNSFMQASERDQEILCTLRGSSHDPVRLRVRQWVKEYSKARGISRFAAQEKNSASRTVISNAYFLEMYRSQIIAMASGALILVDHMFVP